MAEDCRGRCNRVLTDSHAKRTQRAGEEIARRASDPAGEDLVISTDADVLTSPRAGQPNIAFLLMIAGLDTVSVRFHGCSPGWRVIPRNSRRFETIRA